MLKIFLFGHIRLEHERIRAIYKLTPTIQALLAYLLIRPGHTYSRDVLMDLGWGDRPQEQARNCLNTALWRLRSILEPKGVRRGAYLLSGQTGDVGFNWNGDFWMDASAFESIAGPILANGWQAMDDHQAKELEQVLLLYHGDLLEGMYYDWALQERERLRAIYLNALGYLLQYYRLHGHFDQAVTAGQKILHLDPLREEVHRDLMAIFLQNGQRGLAARQYELCCMALQNELGLSPMPETHMLYQQAMADQHALLLSTSKALPTEPVNLLQATTQLKHILEDLDKMREEVKRTLALLKQANNQEFKNR